MKLEQIFDPYLMREFMCIVHCAGKDIACGGISIGVKLEQIFDLYLMREFMCIVHCAGKDDVSKKPLVLYFTNQKYCNHVVSCMSICFYFWCTRLGMLVTIVVGNSYCFPWWDSFR